MKKVLIPVVSFLVLVAVFVLGNFAISSMRKDIEDRRVSGIIFKAFPTADSYEKIENENFRKLDDKNFVYEAYRVLEDGEQAGYVYLTSTEGKFAGLNLATGIRTLTKKVENVAVISNNETPDYFNNVLENTEFWNQFPGKTLDVAQFVLFTQVSGATYSSKGIEKGIQLAREQFAADTNWNLPTAAALVSKEQDLTTRQFKYVFTYEGKQYTVYYYVDYTVAANPDNASDTQMTQFTALAKASRLSKYILSVSTAVNVYTIKIVGEGSASAGSNPIVATLTYDASTKTFTSFVVNSHSETEGYGADAIAAGTQTRLLSEPDYWVSGATETSDALRAILNLAKTYATEVIK
jgi:Na+-translocating ferredoxin:NAD+ oxidoreductase RnfG subunit